VTPDRTAAVERAAGVDPGDPILGVLPGRVASRVEALAWVDDARVVRDLPSTVRIEVVPRIPVGWTRAGDRILVVDADGRVVDATDTAPPGVPELVGVTDMAPVGGEIGPRALPAAAGVLGPELRQRIVTVALEDGAVSAQVVFGPQLRFGPPDRMGLKARVAAAVLASLGPTPVAYVDVSVPTAPVSG
jgi:cell division protein FtsQ